MAVPSGSHVRWLVLNAALLAGCSGTRSTVGDGMFQKRHLRPGWHVDLGGRSSARTDPREAQVTRYEPRPHLYKDSDTSMSVVQVELRAQDDAIASTAPPLPTSFRSSRPPIGPGIGIAAADTTRSALRQQIEEPHRRWNPWAVPAFAAAAGTVALAFATGTSPILVVLGVIVTIVLATIALRKGRKNEWSGKGFAVAAMMIGCLAGLITLIALISP